MCCTANNGKKIEVNYILLVYGFLTVLAASYIIRLAGMGLFSAIDYWYSLDYATGGMFAQSYAQLHSLIFSFASFAVLLSGFVIMVVSIINKNNITMIKNHIRSTATSIAKEGDDL
jgi:hypothetical protein